MGRSQSLYDSTTLSQLTVPGLRAEYDMMGEWEGLITEIFFQRLNITKRWDITLNDNLTISVHFSCHYWHSRYFTHPDLYCDLKRQYYCIVRLERALSHAACTAI